MVSLEALLLFLTRALGQILGYTEVLVCVKRGRPESRLNPFRGPREYIQEAGLP